MFYPTIFLLSNKRKEYIKQVIRLFRTDSVVTLSGTDSVVTFSRTDSVETLYVPDRPVYGAKLKTVYMCRIIRL